MLAVGYLLICLFVGYTIGKSFVPEIFQATVQSFSKKKIKLSSFMVWIPAAWITGILLVTWSVYIVAHFFSSARHPLIYANAIVITFYIVLAMGLLFWKKKASISLKKYTSSDKTTLTIESIFVLICIVFISILMFWTFFVKEDSLYVGYTIFGDFSPHLSMIRSFSKGNNFPTWYTFYSGIDVKYHFMFLFLVGNLEFLGMRIDYAFNVPSIMGMVFVYMLLYVLAVKISGKRKVGCLAGLFFSFRSASSFFTFLVNTPAEENVWTKLKENTAYLSNTPNEDWGLYNFNVFVNQRHIAICLAILLLVLILVLPYLYETYDLWKNMKLEGAKGIRSYFGKTFFKKDGWKIANWKLAVFVGLLSGASAFWNGAVLIALLIVLFFIAALSRKRLDFVIMAGLAGGLSLVQSKVFMEESSLAARYQFGYLAANPTLFGASSFIVKLMGVLLIVLVAAFLYYKGARRYIMFAFATPLIFAFTFCLTTDMNVNHKYVLISFMLLDVIAANFVADMIKKKDIIRNIGVLVLIILLTSTGVYDTRCVFKNNGPEKSLVVKLDAPVTKWIEENAESRDIFLTPPYTIHAITMGGAMLYEGWQTFAWSAGYDTAARNEQVIAMYSATSPEELIKLADENEIRYIVVDDNCRNSEVYTLREDIIAVTYKAVYTEGEGQTALTIYDTMEQLVEIEE